VQKSRDTDPAAALRAQPAARRLAQGQSQVAFQAAQNGSPLGKIEHLALQMGNVEFDKPLPQETQDGLLRVWDQLFQSMSPETHFTIVCADNKGEESVHSLLEKHRIQPERVSVVPAECEKGMSIWIRDSMLPVRNPDGSSKLLVQDRTYWPGPEDGKISSILQAAHPEVNAQDHPALRIDGGNVLSNRHHTFVGSDSIRHTRERLQELAQDPNKRAEIEDFYRQASGQEPGPDMWDDLPRLVFENEFQRPVLVVARHREQPAFHIDMTMTPISDNKFLVGDPGMAIRALRRLSPEERAEVNRSMALQAGISGGEDLVEKLIKANQSAEKQADYDATAHELEEAGYEIQRVPALMGLRTTWSVPYLTYNNCMMENYTNDRGESVKKVYLPQYGCAVLDSIAQAAYLANGFDVVPLEMGAISKLEGAIRCSSYAIKRQF
jgi:N-dimethylarginine dimethylaminohydrolase